MTRRLGRDSAEVGVGTLIVFIAMVLVAAVAAGVIIATSGSLQQRAQLTGQEATAEVSANLMVIGVEGQRNNTASDLWNIHVFMSPAAGTSVIDIGTMLVRYNDGQTTRYIKHLDYANYGYTLTWIRGEGSGYVAKSGDLMQLNFTMKDRVLAPRTDINVELLPETGAPIMLEMRTPNTYASNTYVTIK